ncbi:hypothetical protein MNBD_GAMMA25-107 [hydrothermal vent metagenome]|uniref:Alginate export domain-containing protein n=1 Tax=hydrothermal vent metagenome TaxID=652676 RepID=A0A3B1BC89_9ZZZZ
MLYVWFSRSFKAKCLFFAFLLIGIISPTISYAGVSGRLGIMLQNDNRQYIENKYLEEQGDFIFTNKEYALRGGLSFSLRQSIEPSYSSSAGKNKNALYQLFIEKKQKLSPSSSANFALGRIQRVDGLGFYFIDGGNVDVQIKNWMISAYAGKPGRIDNFRSLSGKMISGMDVSTHQSGLDFSGIDALHARLGWQRYRADSGDKQDRINWSLHGSKVKKQFKQLLSSLDIYFKGTWLPETDKAEDVIASINTHWYRKINIRLTHETYQPVSPYLTFREQFYAIYSRGYQKTLAGEFNYQLTKSRRISLRQRHTSREFGVDGYGYSVAYFLRQAAGAQWLFQYDRLDLNIDSTESYYLELNVSLNSRLRGRFGAAMQKQEKYLYGKNDARAFEMYFEKMLHTDLFVKLTSSYIFNSRLEDEYRIGFRLDYYFDDRITDIISKYAGTENP